MNEQDKYQDRDLLNEGYQEGDLVSITFDDDEFWKEAFVVDNGYGRLVLRNKANEFAIAYPEMKDKIILLEKYNL